MKFIHTSDWHLGRSIEKFSREEEQRAFLEELFRCAEKEKADFLLVAGDIFDTYNPPVWAEKLYYDTLQKFYGIGCGVIVISGNHDSPQGLCSAAALARGCGVIMCESPAAILPAGDYGGIFTITESGEGWFSLTLKNGETATVLAMPYPSESRIAKLIPSLSQEESEIKKDYNERLKEIFEKQKTHFQPDSVNLLVTHLYINGGKTSDSERNFQLGGAFAVNGDTLPAECQYAALGHLHRPQQIKECSCPAYYSGSPLSYSFSETGYAKSFYLVDVIAGQEASVTAIPITCGKTLLSVKADGVEEALNWCRQHAGDPIWAELEIKIDRPLTSEQQRELVETCGGVVSIRPIIQAQEIASPPENRRNKPVSESFADFYRQRVGADIPEELMKSFEELYHS